MMGLSSSDEAEDQQVERLILDIKALVLLEESDAELKAKLGRELVDSQDESVKRFVESVQMGRKSDSGRLLAVALGEMILASILVVVGTVTLIPVMVGATSPQTLINYFAGQFYGNLAGSVFSPYTALIEFGVGGLLIFSAFYTLREAALGLKKAGLAGGPGER